VKRRLNIETLERRQLLTISVTPVLSSSINPAPYGTSVEFAAAMPSNATEGNVVTFKNNGTTIGTGELEPGAAGATRLAADLSLHMLILLLLFAG
jgi:hypothetical protein